MTTTEALCAIDPEVGLQTESPDELFVLLRERIARYTMGDSSSVPVDTARRLLEGMFYCADLCRRRPPDDLASGAPLSERVAAGAAIAKRLAKRAKLLLYEAKRKQPPVTNRTFRETLSALPSFFRGYDADFFSQEIPCSFDYPLCHPVPETLLGVEYMLTYLRRWLMESAFLRVFPADALRSLYMRYYVDYEDLLVNLFLPVAEMATLCALAKAPVQSLTLSPQEYEAASQLIFQQDASAAEKSILAAAKAALSQLGLNSAHLREEMFLTARDLMVRLRSTSILPK